MYPTNMYIVLYVIYYMVCVVNAIRNRFWSGFISTSKKVSWALLELL